MAGKMPLHLRVAQALDEVGPMTKIGLSQEIGSPEDQIVGALKKMRKAGQVTECEFSYSLAQAGRSLLAKARRWEKSKAWHIRKASEV